MNYISTLATFVSFMFAGAVFERYRQSRGLHLLFWALGAFLYGLGSFSEAALSLAFEESVLKLYYLSGAMLTAAWLGQGSIFLLVRKGRVAQYLAAILVLVSVLAAWLVFSAEITSVSASYDVSAAVSAQYKDILVRPGLVIVLTILLNIYGSIGLVGGAIYSAYLFWRKQIMAHRMYGNILIAFGALLSASAGTLTLFGSIDLHSLALLLGVIFMYLGYIQSTLTQSQAPQAG